MPAATYPQVMGFQKYGGYFSEKKNVCGNVPTSSGFPKNQGPFFWKKRRLRHRTHKFRASRNMGPFFPRTKKKRLRQRTHKFRASKNMGPFCVGRKKNACGIEPTSSGLPKILRGKGETCTPPLGQGFRTAWLITGQKFP